MIKVSAATLLGGKQFAPSPWRVGRGSAARHNTPCKGSGAGGGSRGECAVGWPPARRHSVITGPRVQSSTGTTAQPLSARRSAGTDSGPIASRTASRTATRSRRVTSDPGPNSSRRVPIQCTGTSRNSRLKQ